MLEIGSVFNERYEILKILGRGGMSVVYLGRDKRLNCKLAIKEILTTGIWEGEETHRRALMTEATLMRQLSHPAIPTVYDIVENPEHICIVMEYIEGTTLDAVVRASGPQSVENVLNWARQLAQFLSFIHGRSIIYRDMKPANVILCPDGQLKIVDFGIAHNAQDGPDKIIMGTRGYAPPELYRGQYDLRADIFSLGMTLHHLLTDIMPERSERYFPVRHWRPEISESLNAIIDKCVQADPALRYQNCQELLYDLNRCSMETWRNDVPSSAKIGSADLPHVAPKQAAKSIFDFFKRFGKKKTICLAPNTDVTVPSVTTPLVQEEDPGFSLPISAVLSHTDNLTEVTAPLTLTESELTETVYALLSSGSYSELSSVRLCTEYQNISATNRIIWSKISHLNVIGVNNRDVIGALRTAGLRSGAYLNQNSTWLLLIEAKADLIQECVDSCGPSLEVLQIGYSSIETLRLGKVIRLQELRLSKNRILREITGLEALNDLRRLDVSHTALDGLLSLAGLGLLRELNISSTRIRSIFTAHALPQLTDFNAEGSELIDLNFLREMPGLNLLNLSSCPIQNIPSALLRGLPELTELDVSFTRLQELPGLEALVKLDYLDCGDTEILLPPDSVFPGTLTFLRLSRTPNRRIPDGIRYLTALRELHLSNLSLKELPDWLPDIASHFDVGQAATILIRWDRCTVTMIDTTVEGVDMEIFSRPYAMVLQWFREQREMREAAAELPRETPLNEIKVVFLGDGEAGKSLTVARLLEDGCLPAHFDSNATPGIAIAHRTYHLGARNVQVHFWDFCGQEIMHSMHRMFLTQRTLYVVLLNARDDTQDDRARYWLHNIKSFADGAPVLLVINKIDQNPNASVNESGLREAYPALTEVVRTSALTFSQEEFNKAFTDALKRQINNFAELESPFLPAWHKLKERIAGMKSHYIHGPEFNHLCEECGVEADEETRKALLKWFNDLGVSFCYSGSARLEDYVILQPAWITNAIYILLFNPIPGQKNGMVSHEAIYNMLNPPTHLRSSIRRVLPNATYCVSDTEFVLNVIRRFRLSYLVSDNAEFFPMLCRKDALPIAARYAADPQTLEFRMVYEYLPNNVIHRLMVDMHRDLDMENVWLTGARFSQQSTGLSAVVRSEGNALVMYVRSDNIRHPADFYLDIIKDVLEHINQSMGLQVTENQVIFKADGISEPFDYEELLGNLNNGSTTIYSKRRKKMIPIDEILRQTDHRLDEDRERLIDNLMLICQQLQANKLYWDVSENDRNTYVRDTLRAMDYIAMDQSLSGVSAGQKLPGELDLDIRKDPNIPWTIFEGLNLKGTGSAQMENWNTHLKKLLDNYNANGLPFLILTSYVLCSKDRFVDICNEYTVHIKHYSPGIYTVQSMAAGVSSHRTYEPNQFIQVRKCVYDCGGHMTNVYHFFVRIGA